MSLICPRCYSSNATRVHQSSSPNMSSQIGMAAFGTQIARHLPIPSPFGLLAGGLIGSLLGQAFEPPSRPAPVIFQCQDCQHLFH